MASRVPSWHGRVLLPRMNVLKREIKALDTRVECEFRSMHSEIRRLDGKIDPSNKRHEGRIDALDKRSDVAQREAVIEEKMRELETWP